MAVVGLIFAMRWEVPKLISSARSSAFSIGDTQLEVAVSGVGRKKASEAAERLCRARARSLLLSLGFCVAMKPYRVGQLVLANTVCAGGRDLSLESEPLQQARRLISEQGLSYREGKFQTFDRVVTSRRGVADDVVAGDMESFAIAEVARRHGVPLLVVRAVSDVAPDESRWYRSPALFARFLLGIPAARRSLGQFLETCGAGFR